MDIETVIGLILIAIAIVYPIFLFANKWIDQRDRVRELEPQLKSAETELAAAQTEAKQLVERRQAFQAACHKALLDRQHELIFRLRYYDPEDHSECETKGLGFQMGWIQAMWWAANYCDQRWVDKLVQEMMCTSPVTTGHLATWRQELMAAQVYLIRLDWRNGNIGQDAFGRLGHVPDEELRKLVEFVPGMRLTIGRMKTVNCPFPIDTEDLTAFIKRIEALEPAPA